MCPQVNDLPGASEFLYSKLTPADAAYFQVLKLDRVGGRMSDSLGKQSIIPLADNITE